MVSIMQSAGKRGPSRTGSLYFQVLAAIALGILVGALWPDFGTALKPVGDAFVKLVKMVIVPIIFLTVATGIAGMRAVGDVGRVAGKAMVYFLTFSTLALLLGLAVGNIVQPGSHVGADPATLDAAAVANYSKVAHDSSISGFLFDIIPTTMLSALTEGSILQALFIAILFGTSMGLVGERARPVLAVLESTCAVVFRLIAVVMRAAPIGAFGAMAFTVGKFGMASLLSLGALIATFYLTALFFVFVVLGAVCWSNGFSILRLIAYLKAELLLVLGTSSSEAALPALMSKLEGAGCDKGVVGIVVPTGYSFNLDGTNIYLTLAALFIAQACGIDLSAGQQAALFGVAMISSKGSAGVAGAGFITLAATLSIVPSVPIAGMALILGIDRFMSECRSLTNFIGNAVATIVVSRWEGALDRDALHAALMGRVAARPDVVEGALVARQPTEVVATADTL
jgi:aerobic C4-dicarboxylate transport protein